MAVAIVFDFNGNTLRVSPVKGTSGRALHGLGWEVPDIKVLDGFKALASRPGLNCRVDGLPPTDRVGISASPAAGIFVAGFRIPRRKYAERRRNTDSRKQDWLDWRRGYLTARSATCQKASIPFFAALPKRSPHYV